ncbi:MAG: alpha/beta fold hydrolase [Sphingobacteriaceae bacterium]|nr:MAG: alpha/beta fold hydrolase [Sphingobacteriaceae bacterium]
MSFLRAAILIFVSLLSLNAFSQTEPEADKQAVKRFMIFYNTGQPDSIFTRFSPEMKAALPLEQFKTSTVQLRTQLGNLLSTEFISHENRLSSYKATFEKAVFLLNVSLNDKNQFQGLLLKPYQAPGAQQATASIIDASVLTETPYTLKTLSGSIAGSLVKPKNVSGKVPVVLIIPGSGPTDRNGNSDKQNLHPNTYAMLANELGKKGIATLRYDKRLVGQSVSTTKEAELRIDDMIEDALGLANDLAEKGEFSKVFILGHSEGSLIGMIAAREAPLAGFISVAGAGEPAEKVVTEQLKKQPQYVADGFKRIIDSLRKGKLTQSVDPALYALARPSIQTYIMSWFRFDPAKELKKLKLPVLIVQGTTDIQIATVQAEKLKKAKSDAQLLIIPGMNHILKEAPADVKQNTATYSNPNLPLKPEFVKGVVDFVTKL